MEALGIKALRIESLRTKQLLIEEFENDADKSDTKFCFLPARRRLYAV